MCKKIYLASPFFNEQELEIYRSVISQLRAAGYEVYVPQEHEIENAWEKSNADWAQEVYLEDIAAIQECDCVMVLNFGMYSDSGTAWEAGYAMAMGKYTVQVLCGDESAAYSLMMINGCDKVINLKDVGKWEEISVYANCDYVVQK